MKPTEKDYELEIEPLGDRVLLRRVEHAEMVRGLFVPEMAKEKPNQAIVVAVGLDCESVREGDTVLVGKYAGLEIEVEGDQHLVCREEEILGKLHKRPVDSGRSGAEASGDE